MAVKKLTGKAKFEIIRNDMFWECYIDDFRRCGTGFHSVWYSIRWYGYNDSYWWENVAKKDCVAKCTGQKVNGKNWKEKYFKLNYETLDVEEISEEEYRATKGLKEGEPT